MVTERASMDADQSMTCDLCGGQRFALLAERDRRGQPLRTGVCQDCGLVSHWPVPSEEAVARYYAEQYRQDYHGERTPSRRRIMRAWRNGERLVRRLAPELTAGVRVFEVGAGIGCTVKCFELAGFQASGIEPNRDFNRYTRERLRAEVQNCNLYDWTPAADLDLVLLVHVIEHFRSPTAALLKIRDLLADQGLLYVECPNVAAPFATFDRLFHFAHIHNFTPATLQALAGKCGFRVVRRFHDDDHPDVALLLQKTEVPPAAPIPEGEAERVDAAIHRFTTAGYYLRAGYLKRRGAKLAGYARERLVARAFVRDLLQRCARDEEPAS